MSTQSTFILLIIVIVLGVGAWFYYGAPGEVEAPTQGESTSGDYVDASDQAAGPAVDIAQTWLEDGGYVVVHEESNGAPGAILGASEYLAAGEQHADVSVSLSRGSQEGETLYVMLHNDDGDEVFDPSVDMPVRADDGTIIVTPISISAASE